SSTRAREDRMLPLPDCLANPGSSCTARRGSGAGSVESPCARTDEGCAAGFPNFLLRGQSKVHAPEQTRGAPRDTQSFYEATTRRFGCDESGVVVLEVLAAKEKSYFVTDQWSIDSPLKQLAPPGRSHVRKGIASIQVRIPEGESKTAMKMTLGAAPRHHFN